MTTVRLGWASLIALTLTGLAIASGPARWRQTDAPRTQAFVNARIIDGVSPAPIARGVVVVRNGRVAAVGPLDLVTIPADAERVDLTGKTVVPGIVNAHGHVGQNRGFDGGPEVNTEENVLSQLGLYARYGVTTVISLGGDSDAGFRIRESRESPDLDHARLYVAGPVLAPETPAKARDAVEALAVRKPDFVKFRVDDNLGSTSKMPVSVYQTIIEVAQRRGLPVATHLFYLEDAIKLVQAGTNLVAHSVRDQPVTRELIDLLLQREVCVCPTLTRELSTFVYRDRPTFFGDPFFVKEADRTVVERLEEPARQAAMRESESAKAYEAALEVAKANLEALVEAGVSIAFGTDTGPPGRFQGYFEHLELDLMAEAGLTPRQILRAATADAARCMGLDGQVGTLEPGAWADLLVLAGDPLDDIANLHRIDAVYIAGNAVPGVR